MGRFFDTIINQCVLFTDILVQVALVYIYLSSDYQISNLKPID